MYVDVGESMYVRTTLKLREDLYRRLKKEAGVRGISRKVNEILETKLLKKKKSLFGTMQQVDLGDVRDHKDRV